VDPLTAKEAILNTGTLILSLLLLAGLVIIGFGGLIFILGLWWKWKDREKNSLESVLLEVALPRDNEIKIDVAEQFFASLASIKKGSKFLGMPKAQPHLSFEIVGRKEDIRFYICTPKKLTDMVEKQVNGAYPSAEIREVDEYNIFSTQGKVVFAQLKTTSSVYNPLKTYKDLATDPLSSITSAIAKMQEGEGAAIQIIIVPADKGWQKLGKSWISKTKKNEADAEKAKYNVDPKIYDAVENKCSKPGFETTIRIVVCAASKEQAQTHLDNIISAFSQFNSDLNSFGKAKIWFKKLFMLDFIYRYQPMFGSKSILSSEELATIFHLPNKSVETPHIYWLAAKSAPAPSQIPKSGLYLGMSVYRGLRRPVYIGDKDRRRHMYIIGKTGMGKSEFLMEMIMQDIRSGKGICFIDPHDTVERILEMIPPERAEDVIYFDPSDVERPLGLNMIEAKDEYQMHFVSSSIINLMYKLYDPHKTGIIGPRFEHAIRNAMLTVMVESGSTFVEVVRALTDSRFVQELLPKVQDPMVRRYWTDQIAQTTDFHKSEVLDYIVSKFGRFVTNRMIRNIIGQSKSAFDFRKVMDEGKILLINVAKGKIGEENSSFLGTILVPKILIAAMSRQDVPEEQRKDFYLYVDEFQNFATPDFGQILSEARKFRLSLCVANQFIGQIEEEVKNAIFGNVGTLISFRIGVADANYLQHEFQPIFSESDLVNVEAYHAFIKTIVNNEPVPAFSLDLTKDMSKVEAMRSPKVAAMIKQLSRLKYGRDKDIVEAEIVQRAKL
jgi:hypothetical protein